jgi:hypothetical protein
VLCLREGMRIFVKTLTGKTTSPWPNGCISDKSLPRTTSLRLPGLPCASALSAASTLGRWSPSSAVPSASRLTPMSSRGPWRARPSSEATRATSSSACWGQTRHKSILGSPPIISPTSPSKLAETDRWTGGNSWSGTPQCTLAGNPAYQTTG